MCMIIAHFICIMCKMACKAANGIHGVQSYKCDKDKSQKGLPLETKNTQETRFD